MAEKFKTSYRVYAAWDYQKEIEDLNTSSKNGWQLLKGGCFHSRFVYNPDICYRYQLDFRKIEDMGRYIETFREQGWEYINSTFNGWHYFRKLYDPDIPDDAYEIFSDRESLREMNKRWARLAFIVALLCGLAAVVAAGWMIMEPHWPLAIQMSVLAVESIILFRGVRIMRDPDSGRNHRKENVLLAAFLATVIIGIASGIVLSDMRPYLSTEQNAETLAEALVDNRWVSFDVKYQDNYYLDLSMEAEEPFTFEIVNEAGETVFSKTGTNVREENIRIRLTRGKYWLSESAENSFALKCSIE